MMGQLLSCLKPFNKGGTKRHGPTARRTSNVSESRRRLRTNSKNNDNSRGGKDIQNNSLSGENSRKHYQVDFMEAGRRESVTDTRPVDAFTKRAASTITATTGAAMQERIDEGLFEVDIALDHLIREANKRDAVVNDISLQDTFELSDDEEDLVSQGSHSPPVSNIGGATTGEGKDQRKDQLKLKFSMSRLLSVQEGIEMFDASLESDKSLSEQDRNDKSEYGHGRERTGEAERE